MKNIFISKVITYPILAVNIVFIGLLLFSAYSPYIPPKDFPLLAITGLLFPILLFVNLLFLVLWLFVRRKFALFTLVGFLLCCRQIFFCFPVSFHREEVSDSSFKLLSYNVMRFNHFEKKNNKNRILAYIKQEDADIVCMQEYDAATNPEYLTRKDIDRELNKYPYKSIQKIGTQGLSIACYSKYPILSSKKLDCKSNYNGAVAYELVIGRDTATLINCHLESNKLTKEDKVVYEDMLRAPQTDKVKKGTRRLTTKLAEAAVVRAEQAHVVAREIAASRHPYIMVCGDLNDILVSYTHRVISEELNDAFTRSGSGLGISYNQNKFYFRIDHILTGKNLKTYNCTVDRSIKDSDHYPIKCYIQKL